MKREMNVCFDCEKEITKGRREILLFFTILVSEQSKITILVGLYIGEIFFIIFNNFAHENI
jgi:hypothetical protein